MKLIVGLGNPDEKHEFTKHNLGFMVVEHIFQGYEPVQKTAWENSERFKSDIADIVWHSKKRGGEERVLLVKPKTYMNNSGMAVSLLSSYYKIVPDDIWIIHDELDLPLGSMKIRLGGSSAGHKGVQSVMDSLQTEKFWRFRLGIGESHNHHEIAGQKIHNVDDYVLSPFGEGQAGKARELIKHAVKAIQTALEEDLTVAGNRFNTK